ncbi:MAG: DUF2252 family protein [Janthinobacterium lividum]
MKSHPYADPSLRGPALERERQHKMAASAHAYVRGSTKRFYAWLDNLDRAAIPEGPPVWICGDCHVGNLGPIASRDGALAIQIRDLDQTVIGNPAHDLVRLGLSLAMACRGSDLPGVITAHMIEHMMDGYEGAFAPEAEGEVMDESRAMPRPVKLVMRQAMGRSWQHLADERIEGEAAKIPLGRRFWPLTGDERAAVDSLFEERELRSLLTRLRRHGEDAPVRVLDAAYWRKGCSSLGLLRVAALVSTGTGRHERHCLLDLKEAAAAAAPRAGAAAMPQDEAQRVVTGAQHLSPFLGSRMGAATLLGRSVFMRELLPQDLKLEIEHLNQAEALEVAAFLAHVVGRGHARQMTPDERRSWLAELHKNRSRTLDAPFWLWNSIVELVAAHEAAYLEHCRKYALQDAA